MKKVKPTYDDLLKKAKEQELEINRLLKKERLMTNIEFYFKESLDLVCLAGTDGFFKEINPAFIKSLGYTKRELLSTPFLKFVHPADVAKTTAELKQLSEGISSQHFENIFLKKNGENIYIQWTTSVDSSKEIIYAIGRDITKIKKVEADLLESEELLENAQKISKIGSWEIKLATNELIWSDQLYSIYEIDKEANQDLEKEYQKYLSKKEIVFFNNKLDQMKTDLIPFETEYLLTFPDNKKKWITVIAVPIVDNNEEIIAIRGNTQDVTEKKLIKEKLKDRKKNEVALKLKLIEEESNAKFKEYIENAPDGVFITDEKGNYLEANPAATVITGYSNEELLTMTMRDLTPLDSLEELKEAFNKLLKTGAVKGEFQTIHKSGEIRWRAVSAVKISETRFMGFIKDITENRRANELLTKTFERITDGFVALDTNWCYTYMNKKAGEILNRNPIEMIGKHIWTEFPEAINGSFYKACHKSLETQEYIHLDDFDAYNDRWMENHIYPSNDGISNFFRDETLEKIADNKIEQNLNRFRALVENNEGIIALVDENLNSIFRSESATRITGWNHKEFDKISTIEYIHPDYIEYIQQMMQKVLKKPGKPIPVLLQVKHKKGHYIWLEGILKNMLHDTSVKGIISNLRDVTISKKAKEALIIERDKFAKIAATSPGLIYSMRQNLDGSLSYPYASDAINEIYGLTYTDIESNPEKIFELIHPEDVTEVIEKIRITKTDLVPLKGEYRYYHPTKGLVWHEVNSLPVVEPEGTVICHGIITDITERIKADQKLKKANRLYLFISQINQMIVRTTDEKTLFREACTIAVDLGKFRMAWIGIIDQKTKKVVPAMIAGEDNGYLDLIKTISIDNNIKNGNGPGGFAIRENKYVICNDVENDFLMKPWRQEALNRGYNSLMVLPIRKFGKVIGLFCFYSGEKNFFDKEEIALLEEATGDVAFALELFDKEILRKKAEEAVFQSEKRYHTLTEVSPVGIFRTETSGYTTYVNKRWCQISGLSFAEAIGNGWLDAVHKEDKIAILKGWENATSHQETSLSEYRFVRPDGSIAWVFGQAIPERNTENKIVGYIGTITEITERKQAEERVRTSKEKADAANKAKTNFLANMSHEIRTPLNGIIGFTNLLMETNLENHQLEYMSTINESATTLMNIVNDVLDYSKIESGKLELTIEEIDLFELARQIIDLFKYQANQKKIDLKLNIADNIPRFILADSVRLKQILGNLLSNAVKFTNSGKIELDIDEKSYSDESFAEITFSVKDTGIGIKGPNNKKIFKSFVQEDNSTNRKFGGTGLGLAISNQLLALMGSKLDLNSKYGEGSVFFFTIKVKKGDTKKVAGVKVVDDQIEDITIQLEQLKEVSILLVEDNKVNMFLAKTLVRKIIPNCVIVEAIDGCEAIERYREEKLDIIFMDIQMPNKNGYEATHEIREFNGSEKTPIIALTAGIMSGDKDKCIDAGMDDYLPKPIIRSELEEMLYKWLVTKE